MTTFLYEIFQIKLSKHSATKCYLLLNNGKLFAKRVHFKFRQKASIPYGGNIIGVV